MRILAQSIVLFYLRFWARLALTAHRPVVIGIAGSVGKSSTKQVLQAALTPFGKTLATQGNSETGLPLSILGVKVKGYGIADWISYLWQAPFGVFNLVGVEYLIAEMGIDGPKPPKNMDYLLTIVEPDIAVFVQESAAHTEQFEEALTKEEREVLSDEQRLERLVQLIIDEDLKMASASRCSKVIFNADNKELVSAITALRGRKGEQKLFAFGTSNHLDAYYLNAHVSLDETRFDQMIHGAPVTIKYAKAVLPQEYQEVTAAALLTCAALGLNINQAASAIEKHVQLPKGRASVFKGVRNSVVLDSSYNASRESMLAFLSLAQELQRQTKRPLIVALGDMRELGAEAKIEHEIVAKRVVEVADRVYCVGQLTKEYLMPGIDGKVKEAKWFPHTLELGKYLKENLIQDAIVLVKGSQNTIFLEEAIKMILADSTDAAKLCRQEEYWIVSKAKQGFLA